MRLQIVRIVVAGREHVGTDHDSTLDLVAEPFAAAALVQVLDIDRMRRSVTEAHAVVAREVRRRLGRSDHVVRRDGKRAVRERYIQERRTEPLEIENRFLDELPDIGVESVAELLFHDSDADPRQINSKCSRIVVRQPVHRCGIVGVVSGDRAERQCDVLGAAGEDPGLIEARCECDHTEPRDPTVGRLEPGQPSEGGRLTDGATGFGTRGDRGETRCDGGGGPPGRSARDAIRIPWVVDRAVPTRLVGRAHRKLVHVRLSKHHRSADAKALDDCRVVRCDEGIQHSGAARRSDAAGAEDILVCDGNPEQRTILARAAAFVRPSRVGQRDTAGDGDERVESRIVCRDTIEEMSCELDA